MMRRFHGIGPFVLATAAMFGASSAASAASINITADITTSQTWTSDNEYVLTQPIYVKNGATVTIEPGTVVRGEPATGGGINDPGTLIITRGSKIQALGTALEPVVFTDLLDDNIGPNFGSGAYGDKVLSRAIVGQWGGLIVLSYGYVANNTAAAVDPAREVQIEGLDAASGLGFYGNCAAYLPGPYGRNCDDSDSGTIRYVRISYGGFNLSPDNEINGLTYGGVGRGTTTDHVEVYQTKDDAMEIFGGAPQIKYMVFSNHGDDGLDFDEGFRGKAQFVFQMQNVPGSEVTDKGGEWDGGNAPDASQPGSDPTLENMTFVGLGSQKVGYTNKERNTGAHLRDNAGVRVYNSAYLDFGGSTVCIEGASGIGGSATAAGTSGGRAVTPYVVDGTHYLDPPSAFQLEFQDDVFWAFGSDGVLGAALPTVGHCSVTVATQCTQDSECPVGQTCVDGPARWGCDAGKKHYDNGMFTNAALRNTKLTSGNPLPIRQLTRLATGASTHDPVDVIDPRPVSGGSMATSVRTGVAAGGFFDYAPYKGAFLGDVWANGWTLISRLGYLPKCDPANGLSGVPDEIGGLAFASKTGLQWNDLPPFFGYVYDVVRSTTPSDFTAAACVETNDADNVATDATTPAVGSGFYYLVRAGNSCAEGTLGFRTSGVERAGGSCP